MSKPIKIVNIFKPFRHQKMIAWLDYPDQTRYISEVVSWDLDGHTEGNFPLAGTREMPTLDTLVKRHHQAVEFANDGVLIIQRGISESYYIVEEDALLAYAQQTMPEGHLLIGPVNSSETHLPIHMGQYTGDYLRQRFSSEELRQAEVYGLADSIETAALGMSYLQSYLPELNREAILPFNFHGFDNARDALRAIDLYLNDDSIGKDAPRTGKFDARRVEGLISGN